MQNKILIVILEQQNSNSTETNYFNSLVKQFKKLPNYSNIKKDLNNVLFNKKETLSIDFEVIENRKNIKIQYLKDKLFNYIDIIKPNKIYGIIDNDDANLRDLAKCNFEKICSLVDSCYKEGKIFLIPPEELAFEYFMILHIGEKNNIPLDKKIINEKLKSILNVKDLRHIKNDPDIFYKLVNNGVQKLFENVNQHQERHQYKQFVNNIFVKPRIKKIKD